ncbi:BTAD domain-containing putative transcriptional regulator [Kitasatospora gansuensis]
MLTIRLFGAVEIRAAAQLVPLRSNRERAVLAALAHDLGKAVSHDVLTQRVWDDEPPANALALLYSYVSRLRRAFRDAIEQTGSDGPAPEVTSGPRTYTLEADRTAVDWHRYLRAAARARTLAEAGDDRAALAAFDQAEALWHGEALAGLPGLWAQATRTRMAEQRLATTLHRYPIELRLGRFTDLVPELSRQLDQHPGNESLAYHLLIALYGAGRPGDALTTFQRVRHHLLNELGTDPGPQLTHLHDRILNQAPVAELLPDRQPAPRGTSHRSTALSNLPGMSHLIGRDDVLAQVAEADRQRARIQVLSGMPGVGKTELALHAADRLQSRYPDGRIYLSLQGHSTPQSPPLPTHSALLFLLRTLGAPADSLHADTAELSTRWRTELAARRMVVILDDVASPEQVRPLLPDSPSSTALLTSRHRLTELSGAHTHFLDLLPEAESIALFRHLVGQERTDDIAQVGDIVARLGQLPLALAIGAARLKGRPTWTLERLARRLAREPGRLGEIRDEFRDVARVFEMSYLALSGDQRSGFRRLGLHPGPDFGSFEAEALIGRPGGQSERIIESLLNCHLLQEISPSAIASTTCSASTRAPWPNARSPPANARQPSAAWFSPVSGSPTRPIASSTPADPGFPSPASRALIRTGPMRRIRTTGSPSRVQPWWRPSCRPGAPD